MAKDPRRNELKTCYRCLFSEFTQPNGTGIAILKCRYNRKEFCDRDRLFNIACAKFQRVDAIGNPELYPAGSHGEAICRLNRRERAEREARYL